MRRFGLVIFNSVFALFLAFQCETTFAATTPIVVIDPGHGGMDTGAAYENAIESKIVFSLAQKVSAELDKEHISNVMTRHQDLQLSLATRVKKAEDAQAQLFVSFHANAAPEASVHGFEIFLYTPIKNDVQRHVSAAKERDTTIKSILGDMDEQTRFFKSLKTSEEFSNRLGGSKKAGDFFVLRKAKIPAVLIEVGFLSNARDRARLLKEDYQNELSLKMADAIKSTIARLQLESKELRIASPKL